MRWSWVVLLLVVAGCSSKHLGEVCKTTDQCDHGLTCCGTCVDTQKDLTHCGSCTQACGTQNAGALCIAGACHLACQAGFGDCNGAAADGCEADLTASANSCGACTTTCHAINGAAVCRTSSCALGDCNMGFANCDHQAPNGCEVDTRISAQHCGGCGMACLLPHATARCAASSCVVGVCDTGWGDCDTAQPGCETNTLISSLHCGTCTNVCGAGLTCVMGECRPQELLLYGGFQDAQMTTASGGVWRFNVVSKLFSQVTVSTDGGTPGPRGDHVAAWDRAGNRMLVFGGNDGVSVASSDVWALDFSVDPPAWKTPTVTGTPPSARFGAAAAFDGAGRKWYVFGGADDLGNPTPQSDGFVFDAATDTWSSLPSGPTGRYFAAATWDATSQRFIIMGGSDSQSSAADDTWAYDPTPSTGGWQQLTFSSSTPPARLGHVFLPGQLTLFGGLDDTSGLDFFDDTWTLTVTPASWHLESPAASPPARGLLSAASLNGVGYVFGGFAFDPLTFLETDYDDVWVYVAATKNWAVQRRTGTAGGPGVSQGCSLVGRE